MSDKAKQRINLSGGYWIEGRSIFREDEGLIHVARFTTLLDRRANAQAVEDFAIAMNAQATQLADAQAQLVEIHSELFHLAQHANGLKAHDGGWQVMRSKLIKIYTNIEATRQPTQDKGE